jgi:hypothetical protein
MVILWYGLAPAAGTLIGRYRWYKFKERFNILRRSPFLHYRIYWQLEKAEKDNGSPCGSEKFFCFTGGLESITDGHTLWLRNEELTIPVSLKNAKTYLLPMQDRDEGNDDGSSRNMPRPGEADMETVRWDKVSSLTEGTKVFVGGGLVFLDGRWIFASTKENPLMVILYDGADSSFAARVINAGGSRSEYWNNVTLYSLIIGALCLISMAASFLYRPAFRLTVIVSLLALCVPLYPILPPGLLFTIAHRWLSWKARIQRAYSDLARFGFLPGNMEKLPPAKYTARAYCLEAAALIMLLAGIGLNIFFLRIVLSLL